MTDLPSPSELSLAQSLIMEAGHVVALTGAGVSVPSGIPAFRGSQGLWAKYDPFEYAHIESFKADPAKVWEMLLELRAMVQGARPNPAHLALADLERLGKLEAIITQNVDNLHQEAGSGYVIEFHGNGSRLICLDCGRSKPRQKEDFKVIPPRCGCGGLLKPGVVFFGEGIPQEPFQRAVAAVRQADLLLVAGTSAQVTPASLMPALALEQGARIIEINLEPTELTGSVAGLTLFGPAEVILPELAQGVRSELAAG